MGADSSLDIAAGSCQTCGQVMRGILASMMAHRDLLLILVSRNIKIRYKRSVLGFFWTLLQPILLIVIYGTFLKLLKTYDGSNPLFMPMLVVGIFAWQFQSMCMNDSLYAILGNANLVKKTSFPRIILPLSTVLANLVNFLLTLPILTVYVGIVGIGDGAFWLLPFLVVTQTALCLGLSLFLSALNVFFRDTEHLLSVAMLAWFFLSPIIYPFSYIPEAYQRLAMLNPLAGIVTGYRTAFLGTDIIAPRLVLLSCALSWVVLLAGLLFFRVSRRRFGDVL